MSNFQVPLNGSNFTSKERRKAFQDALADDHRIDCLNDPPLTVADAGFSPSALKSESLASVPAQPAASQAAHLPQAQAGQSGIEQALHHTFAHQSRTMEIHQQYLAQQAEYVQLITAVLNQQGKVLDKGNGSPNAAIIETFQRTLDNFHAIREQGLRVHQDFLSQQAAFSERYLNALEGAPLSALKPTPPLQAAAPIQQSLAPEWVVQEPHIVLDEQGRDISLAAQPVEPELPASAPANSQAAAVSSEVLAGALLQIVADKTGYPAEMLELNMDLEADLGIDSIKRVEILGALEEQFPALPAADTQVLAQTRTLQEIVSYMEQEAGSLPAQAEVDPPASQPEASPAAPNHGASQAVAQPIERTSGPSAEELTAILLDVVAEKTGYPAEMLEPGMDMEADLGIDSIKRVEILGAMEERLPGLPSVAAEALGELRTLGQIVELMRVRDSGSEPPESAPAGVDAKKKADPPGPENTPVKLIQLPEPDRLELNLTQERPLIVSSDGSPFTIQVVKSLQAEGWTVLVWEFPASPGLKLPKGTKRISQTESGKQAIASALAAARADHGVPAGFIHLHPQAEGNGLFSDQEEALIREVFLLAGAIKSDLSGQDAGSETLFLVVTRTDGSLGLTNQESFQEGSGLTGLVKSLHWEWPGVFCRAVDLSRKIKEQDAAALLIRELHDPDRTLLEVGINQTSRVTLDRDHGK